MTCHFDFFNFVISQYNQRYLVLMVYFNISKAFDMANHQLLIDKLSFYGVQKHLFALFDSFRSHWHQIVKINSFFSYAVSVRSCVIQGDVLDPLLFF